MQTLSPKRWLIIMLLAAGLAALFPQDAWAGLPYQTVPTAPPNTRTPTVTFTVTAPGGETAQPVNATPTPQPTVRQGASATPVSTLAQPATSLPALTSPTSAPPAPTSTAPSSSSGLASATLLPIASQVAGVTATAAVPGNANNLTGWGCSALGLVLAALGLAFWRRTRSTRA